MKHASLEATLADAFVAAIAEVTGLAAGSFDPGVRPATDPRFGDYQCNAALALAGPLRVRPRELAQRIKAGAELRLAGIAEPLEIAGPGFINVRLTNAFLASYLASIPAPSGPLRPETGDAAAGALDRVGIERVASPQRVVVEYSQPNIAKQMHVGHLRSTIIGDVFARVLAFAGHDVVRQNHIGDWGTQFGMLIRWYREHPLPTTQTHEDVLEAIEADYRAAQQRFDADAEFAREARGAVGALQGGDPAARQVWQKICDVSWQAFTDLYERLGVLLRPEDVRGESFYNDRLAPLVAELQTRLPPVPPGAPKPRAEVREDQGAVVVYLYDEQGAPQFKNPDGEILGLIIQKSDGAFLYATTDLAAIRFRLHELQFPTGVGAQRVIYVTDARQKLHFQMFFAAARAAGWIPDGARVDHVTYGSVLGVDRKPLKTRSGRNVKLRELLDEAERRAARLLEERQTAGEEVLDAAERDLIARRVGIAAVKYADLCRDRNADYVFNWDTMLAMQGNTAPYLLYGYARIRSIYRKAAERIGSPDVYDPTVRIVLGEPTERALALRLARLGEAIDVVAADLTPHVLCTYLYDLATDFMRFYETCPVLGAGDDATRLSRLRLCDLTARALRLGLGLLGIEVLERM